MLRLLLLRHAKATPHIAEDHSRMLAAKGRTDAARIGQYLHDEHLIPDLVIASDALRTRETAMLALKPFEPAIPLHLEPKLYLADAPALFKLLHQVSKTAKTFLAVGHNPGFHDLAHLLIGYGDRYAFARLKAKMPTCALAVIDFDVESWQSIQPRSGRLDRFITPSYFTGDDDD